MSSRRVCLVATVLLLAGLLAGCASGPRYDLDQARTDLTPEAVGKAGQAFVGEPVVWGGRIIETRPGEDVTEVELLGYPLGRHQVPSHQRASQGRFLIRTTGFLEPGDWQTGRLVTVRGNLERSEEGEVGEAIYRYPVVRADDLYLWPEETAARQRPRGSPRVNIGIGVIYSR